MEIDLNKALEPIEEGIKLLLDKHGEIVAGLAETNGKVQKLELAAKCTEEWLADFERRHAAKRFSYQGGDDVIAALGEAGKKHLQVAERMVAMWKANPIKARQHPHYDDPVLLAASGRWWKLHLLKLTKPGDFHAFHEEYERLGAALGGFEKVALQEDVAAEGGNLVPTVVQNEILRLIQDNSVVRASGVRVVPMTVKTHAWPTETTANIAAAAIIAEEGVITDVITAGPFGQSNLTAKKLAAFSTVSDELMQDNVVALGDYLSTRFAELIGRLEDLQALEGDGTGVNFTGLAAVAGINQVAAESPLGTTTNGGPPRYPQFAKTIGKASEAASRQGGVWYMHPQLFYSGILAGKADSITAGDQAGLPLVSLVPNALTGEPAEYLFGRRAYLSSAISIARTKGTLLTATNAYFGPPNAIVLGDLLGLQVDLNPFSKFSTFQVDIRALKRTGILVGVPSAFTKYTDIDITKPMV